MKIDKTYLTKCKFIMLSKNITESLIHTEKTHYTVHRLLNPAILLWEGGGGGGGWQVNYNIFKLQMQLLRTTRGSMYVSMSVLALMPFTQKIFRQPIPENL